MTSDIKILSIRELEARDTRQDYCICFCPVQSYLWLNQVGPQSNLKWARGVCPNPIALMLLYWQESTSCEIWTGKKVVQGEEIITFYTYTGDLGASQEPCHLPQSLCYVQALPFRKRKCCVLPTIQFNHIAHFPNFPSQTLGMHVTSPRFCSLTFWRSIDLIVSFKVA